MGPRSRHALELIFALAIAPLCLAADNPLGGTAKPAPLSEVVQADTVPLPPPMDETPPAETDNRKKQQADAPAILILSNAYLQTANWLRRPSVPATRPADGVVPASAQDVEQLPTPQWRGDMFHCEVFPNTTVAIEGLIRGYYRNDQRINWSGLEDTFGAEGILRPMIQSVQENWTVSAQAEFFLNEPYGTSILSDPHRDLYRANFQIQPFEVFQMFGQVQYEDFILRLGKTRTPFGSYYSPSFTNTLADAPFIRTEVIAWTETGLFLHYEHGIFCGDLALVNGEPNLDTNSSKGVIARVGVIQPFWTAGASVKWQDGISSEQQKRFNNVVGLDWALHSGRFVVYGEATYDQYGFWRNFDLLGNPLNLGIRSLYHRDVFSGHERTPLNGVGYYVAAGYHGERWLFDLSFGSYFPQAVGIPAQDATIHRGVAKVAFAVTPNYQIFAVGLAENDRPPDGVLLNNRQFMILGGMQLAF